MPTFDTPGPISVAFEIAVGDVRIIAGERHDTVVEVRPSDASHEPDVRAAQQTRVEHAAGRLVVRTPKPRTMGLFGKVGSIDVTIELPAGSNVQGDAAKATLRATGRLGKCRIAAAAGEIQLDHTGPVDLSTSAGAIAVDCVAGNAQIRTASGQMRMREIQGSAVLKSANGDCWVGEIAGDLRVSAANGDISVDRAGGGVSANTANGDVRVGGLARGSVELTTARGGIEVGVDTGTAARLDVSTKFGTVRNELDTVAGPEPSDETVDVRARTAFGDIVIRRSAASRPAGSS
ncbi:MAG: DUF4097 family beta strand repeat-containing protein [Acidimicrobiia bacterium]